MSDFSVVHKQRSQVDNQPVDILVLKDEDFRSLMLEGRGAQTFIKEHQQDNVAVVLVGCPSLTSVIPEGMNFPLSLLQEVCQHI